MLTRLTVDGFKNLVGVDLYFGPFTCIAGPNAVGKSNLFDAIRFLSALMDMPILDAALLHDVLLEASELSGRRRQKLNPRQMARRLGDLIEDYGPLRKLTAFRTLEDDTIAALRDLTES